MQIRTGRSSESDGNSSGLSVKSKSPLRLVRAHVAGGFYPRPPQSALQQPSRGTSCRHPYLTAQVKLTQLGTRTGAKRRAWFSRSTSRTLRTAIRVMGLLTGGSLRRPSQAVLNHRTAVRLRRDSLAAIVWMQRGLGQLRVTNHQDLLPGAAAPAAVLPGRPERPCQGQVARPAQCATLDG